MIGGVTGIILAAGSSSRMGRPKQLLAVDGKPLLQHAVDAMERAGLFDIVLVLGHEAERVAAAVQTGPGTRTVVNPDYADGQATSLRTGLEAVPEDAEAAVVILGDQPGVGPIAVRSVVEAFHSGGGRVVQATFGGRPSHPTLFRRELWPELLAIEGDRGAREVIRRHPDWVVPVEQGGDLPPDLDTWDDYERYVRG